MFTVWQLLADFRAGKTISLVKSHATICFASYSAWQTRITRSPDDLTLLWCRIQSFSEIENNKFVYGLQNWFVFVVALILDYYPLPILYLANHWTKFKMLLTSNRFLYLIRFLLLSFPLIPQFIAQFRSICLFLCSSPYFLPVATKWELEQSMHCPLCHCCHSFLFSPSERTKWRSKKVLKSLS